MIKSLKLNCNVPKPKLDFAQSSPVGARMCQIDSQIYVGNYDAAQDLLGLQSEGITHIVNCSPMNCPNLFEDKITYQIVDIKDDVNCDIVKYLLLFVIQYLNEIIQNGGRVLVHCSQGISRAPSIILGYLIWKNKIDVETALRLVREKYEIADPNLGFLLQLQSFSDEIIATYKSEVAKDSRQEFATKENMEIEKSSPVFEARGIFLEQN